MPTTNDVLVFIPSYGDSEALVGITSGIAALGKRYRCLIVDDGSLKPIVAPDVGQTLVARLPSNFGLGTSMEIAFRHAVEHGYGVVVRMDADGQHRVRDVPRLLAALEAGTADMVVGVRVNQDEHDVSWLRRMMKVYLRVLASVTTGGAAPRDVNSGFFAVGAHALCLLRSVRFERFPEPELFVWACMAGLRVVSVDVMQERRAHGKSTLTVIAAARIFFRFNIFAAGQLIRRTVRWFTP